LIIDRTLALGMQGKVTISHAFCLGSPDRDLVDPLIDALAHAEIAIMTTGPASRPAPPVRRLVERGIVVCSGSDGIRDSWGPYGNADMLERAMFVGLRNNFRLDADIELALDVCTHGGAKVMALKDYGLAAGCAADFVLADGESLTETVVSRAPRRLVVKRGRVVARDGKALVSVA
jgi:cytosine/adenosine deaminase-related metal-dependent hydrolase